MKRNKEHQVHDFTRQDLDRQFSTVLTELLTSGYRYVFDEKGHLFYGFDKYVLVEKEGHQFALVVIDKLNKIAKEDSQGFVISDYYVTESLVLVSTEYRCSSRYDTLLSQSVKTYYTLYYVENCINNSNTDKGSIYYRDKEMPERICQKRVERQMYRRYVNSELLMTIPLTETPYKGFRKNAVVKIYNKHQELINPNGRKVVINKWSGGLYSWNLKRA